MGQEAIRALGREKRDVQQAGDQSVEVKNILQAKVERLNIQIQLEEMKTKKGVSYPRRMYESKRTVM